MATKRTLGASALALILGTLAAAQAFGGGRHHDYWRSEHKPNKPGPRPPQNIQLGPRPYFLVEDMAPSALKSKLESCAEGPFESSDFSIGHRGAALQFPELT